MESWIGGAESCWMVGGIRRCAIGLFTYQVSFCAPFALRCKVDADATRADYGQLRPLIGHPTAWRLADKSSCVDIDGKQARRTGTSSPLGELFDHGIDTLNCPLGGLVQATAMGLGNSGYSLFCILVACWSMYLVRMPFISVIGYSEVSNHFHGVEHLGRVSHRDFIPRIFQWVCLTSSSRSPCVRSLQYIHRPVEGVLMAVSVLVISTFWGSSLSLQCLACSTDILVSKGPGWWSQPLSSLNIPFTSPSPSTKILDLMMLFVLLAFLICHLPLWFCLSLSRFPLSFLQD